MSDAEMAMSVYSRFMTNSTRESLGQSDTCRNAQKAREPIISPKGVEKRLNWANEGQMTFHNDDPSSKPDLY